jgi:voltage-gated potassium channel
LGKTTKLEKLILILSIYVVVELYVHTLFQYSDIVSLTVLIIDTLICLIFLYEFFLGFRKSSSKSSFLRRNWIDFISSIPMVGVLRIGRVVRVIRIFRLFRGGKIITEYVKENRSLNTFQLVLFFTVVLLILSTLSIYTLERDINPEIETIWDGLWWSIITISTIGYGDIIPITPEGRIFTVILIWVGIGLIGTFTGVIVNYFVKDEEILSRLNSIELQLKQIDEKLGKKE